MSTIGTAGAGARSKGLILTAMIFAVAMTFIDQTIVSIAAPTIQHDLGLSSSASRQALIAHCMPLLDSPRSRWTVGAAIETMV